MIDEAMRRKTLGPTKILKGFKPLYPCLGFWMRLPITAR
jgi:hypothetical protein